MPPDSRDVLPPTDLADLSTLRLNAPSMALQRYFLGSGPMRHDAYVLQFNAVRLADVALAEYVSAREVVSKFHADHNSPGVHYYHRASAHFENCIWAIERFIKHAKAIRSATFVPQELASLIPKRSSFLQSGVEKSVTRARHTLAHLEAAALKGELPEGSNIALLPLKSGLSVGEHVIQWSSLAQWLTDINTCGSALAGYRPPVGATTDGQAA